MKIFEIPYNFDKNLINLLYNLDPSGNLYHSIYIPPFPEDYITAKNNYINAENLEIKNLHALNRQQYIEHIEYIKKYFSNKIMLLLQQNNNCINEDILQFYFNLGFNKFCVGSIQQAKIIRNLLPNSEIIGSITMKINPLDLQNPDYEIFNGFVLFFPFNRQYNAIKNLPKQFKYILLVNCDCNIYCSGTHHWFATKEQEKNIKCPNKTKFCWENIIRIEPKDLYLFEPYISYFKLQGREFASERIFKDLLLYAGEYNKINPKLNIPTSKYQNNNIDFLKNL